MAGNIEITKVAKFHAKTSTSASRFSHPVKIGGYFDSSQREAWDIRDLNIAGRTSRDW